GLEGEDAGGSRREQHGQPDGRQDAAPTGRGQGKRQGRQSEAAGEDAGDKTEGMTRATAFALAVIPLAALLVRAQPPGCGGADGVEVAWDGGDRDLRMRFAIDNGTPAIRELAIRKRGSAWRTLASNVRPEFRVVSGLRRMSNQQMQPLRELGVELTPEIVNEKKWDAFWDAPLDLNPQVGRGGNPPPAGGVAGQPGLPRKPDEIQRATARYTADRCDVTTGAARTDVSFPGVHLGVFEGSLQFTVYKGTSLIRMEAVAKTERPSVAYKYDAGLSGLAVASDSRMAWRDTSNSWQEYRFGGAANEREMPLKAANRLLIAERGTSGS